MLLAGSLRHTTLGDLLGALYRSCADGVLELTEQSGVCANKHHRIQLRGGLVEAVESSLAGECLGEILTRTGHLDPAILQKVLIELAHNPIHRLGELLVARRWVDTHPVQWALKLQFRARLEPLFSLKEARVKFHASCPRRPGVVVQLIPEEFLHGRQRAVRRAGTESHQRIKTDLYKSRDACSVLGLAPGADAIAVRRAFRELARRRHPDANPDSSDSERAVLAKDFACLSRAYHELMSNFDLRS